MKQFFTFILLLLTQVIFSQAIEVISGLNSPQDSELIGNDLYFTQADFQTFTNGKLSRINITHTTPVVTDLFTGFIDVPSAILLNGNDLYFSEQSTIYKIDISAANPILQVVYQLPNNQTETYAIEGLAFNGNDLYFTESWNGIIYKLNVTDDNPQPTQIITGLSSPVSILINGNDAYVSDYFNNQISKFDITDANPSLTVVTSNVVSPYALALRANELYFSEFDVNRISYIDITEPSPIVVNLVTGVSSPNGLNIAGDALYFSEIFNGGIFRVDLPPLSVEDEILPEIKVFPNPTSNYLQITGLTSLENYSITNALGQNVISGTLDFNEQINVINLDKGMYQIRFENGGIVRFIKN